MASWAAKRKLQYLSIVAVALLLLVVLPLFAIFYKKPTCADGKKNGDETGIDCGGSCIRLCDFEALSPIVVWSRVFRVTDDMYSAVAYVENPNITSEARNVPYAFKIYDQDNILITERKGEAYIPRSKRFAIFEGKIPVTDRKPRSAKFEFTASPVWVKSLEPTPQIVVKSRALSREEVSPRIEAELSNNTLDAYSNIEVTAIVYDGNNNAVGASRTYVESIKKESSKDVVFTWPLPFEAKLDVCEIPADVMLVLDRSGSMRSDQADPPQPLTDAKNAAKTFIAELKGDDEVGLVSFATEPSEPVDAAMTNNHKAVEARVDAVQILDSGTQYTNLGGGILSAFNQFATKSRAAGEKRVIVALTDGIATKPEKKDDPNYPSTYASEAASKTKEGGIELYMIGLGNEVNASFLQTIASTPEHYYAAANSKQLAGIYKDIATKICKKRPAVIEIITRVLPQDVEF